jgi:hypothetical protein
MWTDPGNILIAHRHKNVEIGAEAAQFPEKEYIKRNCRCSVVHLVSKILIFFNGTSGTRKWMPGNSKDTF